MRYNDWQRDPFSVDYRSGHRSAELAIAARDDLDTTGPAAFGNTDAKFVGSQDVANMRLEAVCGPSHDVQPVFGWSGVWANNTYHEGHPVEFNFSWYTFSTQP